MFEKRITILTKTGEKSTLLQTLLNRYKTAKSVIFVTFNIENSLTEMHITVKEWNILKLEKDLSKYLKSEYIGIRV